MAAVMALLLAEVVGRREKSLLDSKIVAIESPIVARSRRESSLLSTVGSWPSSACLGRLRELAQH